MDSRQTEMISLAIVQVGEMISEKIGEAFGDTMNTFDRHDRFEDGRGALADCVLAIADSIKDPEGNATIADIADRLVEAIHPHGSTGLMETGNRSGSLSESVMGVADGLVLVARAIETTVAANSLNPRNP